jgi:plasmid stabilization system protein ParE
LRLLFSAEADADLQQIADWYIFKASAETAERVVANLIVTAQRALHFPESGRRTRTADEREFIAAPYVIRYRIFHDRIVVLWIRHGAQERRP